MPKFLTLLGGGSATSGNTLGCKAIERGILKYFPSIATRVELSTEAKTISRIEDKSADFGVVSESNVANIVSGRADPFKKHTNVRVVGQYQNGSYFIFVTLGDSPINSIKDLLGKRISVGGVGSTTKAVTEIILKAYGFDYKAMEAAGGVLYTTASWAEAIEMLIAGQLDAVPVWTPHPEPATLALAQGRRGMKILPMEEGIQKVLKEVAGMAPVTIAGNDYPGQKGPFNTFGNSLRVIGRADMPDDVMYNLMAAGYWGDAAEFRATPIWAKLEQINLMVGTEVADVPWHPGAKKFWWELWKMRGLLK